MNKHAPRPIIAIGDAHGEYHSFAAVLIHAGLMNPELTWTGGKTILIQMGDILDRGSDPLHIDRLLDVLQIQARAKGGDIIRLIGNHELEILRKNYFITSLPYFQIEPFRQKLLRGIEHGRLCAAYSARGFLFTHAGVCDNLFAALKKEVAPKGKPSPTAFAKHINKIFKEAAKTSNYHHPIFNVSYIRGGSERFGGIFWEDISSIIHNHALCPFKQIIGHTSVPNISHSDDGKIIAIDVGMSKVFEGDFEYLKIKSPKKVTICKVK